MEPKGNLHALSNQPSNQLDRPLISTLAVYQTDACQTCNSSYVSLQGDHDLW